MATNLAIHLHLGIVKGLARNLSFALTFHGVIVLDQTVCYVALNQTD